MIQLERYKTYKFRVDLIEDILLATHNLDDEIVILVDRVGLGFCHHIREFLPKATPSIVTIQAKISCIDEKTIFAHYNRILVYKDSIKLL